MAVTSLIKPVQDKKGILYNFQGALEDITITLSNKVNEVRFSKFALLRIPEIGEPDSLVTDNKIQFFSQGETPLIDGLGTDQNINLAAIGFYFHNGVLAGFTIGNIKVNGNNCCLIFV